ncbi:MAG: efflux RND transporter periplasmic adaptor subunit [Candidatus Staskawiczbacteria bacterium]|nr:efflux RND transporter periplasmic adaptor subunit [Candidatus Staskawiczbacteria bacterium]
MKIKVPKFLKNLPAGRHGKRNIWITAILALILIIILYFIFGRGNNPGSIQTGFATKQNLQETVLSTGQVVSGTDLSLSFQGSGVVRRVSVKEGDKVYQGQVLASLDQSSALATLTSAKGALAQAQASYDKLVNGLSQSDIQVYQNAVSSAQVNLNNTYNSALITLNNSYTAIYNAYSNVANLQINYFSASDQQGIVVQENRNSIGNNLANAKASISQANNPGNIDLAISNMQNYLNSAFNSLQIIRDQCDQAAYYSNVPAADKASLDAQKTAIITATTSINTLQSSIASYKTALQTAQDNLSAKQAKPRQEDVDLAEGQVLSAQGQVESAQAVLNNSIVAAPTSGTITQVDIKVGELATPSKEVIVLQDIGNLHAEADVSEANVASLQIGQPIDYTFDALGPDRHFAGKVLTINPASTVISGVVDYKVTGSLDNVPDIKPGMTANMTILVAKKDNVLAVPSTAIINSNSKQYVKVIDDPKKKTYHQVQVQTGLQADGGLVEIISGITDGQEIVTYIKP